MVLIYLYCNTQYFDFLSKYSVVLMKFLRQFDVMFSHETPASELLEGS